MYFSNDEAREKLLTALTDGSHEQARGRLMGYTEGDKKVGFCCLGVAANVSGCGEFDVTNGYFFDTVTSALPTTDHQSSNYLTKNVAEWLGLNWDNPYDAGYKNFNSTNPGFKAKDCNGVLLSTQPRHYDKDGMPASEPTPMAFGLANLNDQGFTFSQIADCIRYFMSGPAKVDDDVHAEQE